ncbi:MAG: right-handed parallel beta-helix repeat-containing protein [Candidatus Poribacteria bacterium]|nr:right-handed parallel beta-helix repeat-containing protein [Candidatus Poribacteria bacterium]
MKQIRMYTNLAFIALLFSLSSLAFAATIHVPADQPTIQSGIDIARNGDTVLVDDGVYTGEGNVNLDFKGKRIIVKSRNGAEKTIIDCEKKLETRGFIFQNEETDASVLDGFTIKNGNQKFGGGIYLITSSPIIKNCVIDSNQSIPGGGGGIDCINSDPIMTDCRITRNFGGGIFIIGNSEHKGVISKEPLTQPTLKNCTIAENIGHGIYCMRDVNPIIDNCVVSHNSHRGILYTYAPLTSNPITNCRIEHNAGGGLEAWENSVLKIENSIIVRNTAAIGGGISCSYNSEIWVSDCFIAHNSAKLGGGIQATSILGKVNINQCTITKNTADSRGGGVYIHSHRDLLIGRNPFHLTNSIVWGNSSNGTHAEVSVLGSGIVIRSCDIGEGLDGIEAEIGPVADGDEFIYENNIDADPLFIDADSGNFRLKPNSPAAGMGVRERAFQTGPFAVSQHGKRLVKWADLKRK